MILTSKRKNGTRRVQLQMESNEHIFVEQTHAKLVDINSIVRKYKKTGQLPALTEPGHYGNFHLADDFHDAQNRILLAEDLFMALPSEVRKRFDNDPGEFLEFVNDPENLEEAQELGLLEKPRAAHLVPPEPVIPPEKAPPGAQPAPEPPPAKK